MEYSVATFNYDYQESFLDSFLHLAPSVKFSKRQLVNMQYSETDTIYLVKQGLVRQFFTDEKGRARTLLVLGRGDIFGEISYLQDSIDMVNTETLTPAEIVAIDKDVWHAELNKNEDLKLQLAISISTKFRIVMYQIHDSTFYDVKKRLYNLLYRLAIQRGAPTDDGLRIGFSLTHEDLADLINSTRSTVSRKIKELKSERRVKKVNGYYIVKT